MKPFLLMAGNYDQVNTRTSSWLGFFASEKEAESNVKTVHLGNRNTYKSIGGYYDWVEVVDLRKWIS